MASSDTDLDAVVGLGEELSFDDRRGLTGLLWRFRFPVPLAVLGVALFVLERAVPMRFDPLPLGAPIVIAAALWAVALGFSLTTLRLVAAVVIIVVSVGLVDIGATARVEREARIAQTLGQELQIELRALEAARTTRAEVLEDIRAVLIEIDDAIHTCRSIEQILRVLDGWTVEGAEHYREALQALRDEARGPLVDATQAVRAAWSSLGVVGTQDPVGLAPVEVGEGVEDPSQSACDSSAAGLDENDVDCSAKRASERPDVIVDEESDLSGPASSLAQGNRRAAVDASREMSSSLDQVDEVVLPLIRLQRQVSGGAPGEIAVEGERTASLAASFDVCGDRVRALSDDQSLALEDSLPPVPFLPQPAHDEDCSGRPAPDRSTTLVAATATADRCLEACFGSDGDDDALMAELAPSGVDGEVRAAVGNADVSGEHLDDSQGTCQPRAATRHLLAAFQDELVRLTERDSVADSRRALELRLQEVREALAVLDESVAVYELASDGADDLVGGFMRGVDALGADTPAGLGGWGWLAVVLCLVLGYRFLEIVNDARSPGPVVVRPGEGTDGSPTAATIVAADLVRAHLGAVDLQEPSPVPGGEAISSISNSAEASGAENAILRFVAHLAQNTIFPRRGVEVFVSTHVVGRRDRWARSRRTRGCSPDHGQSFDDASQRARLQPVLRCDQPRRSDARRRLLLGRAASRCRLDDAFVAHLDVPERHGASPLSGGADRPTQSAAAPAYPPGGRRRGSSRHRDPSGGSRASRASTTSEGGGAGQSGNGSRSCGTLQ